MVSLHTPLSPTQGETIRGYDHELENLTKKRKREEAQVEGVFGKATIYDKELHLESPLPLEWQRCLDIKSGEIHYLNTRTQKRTTKDPRISPEPPSNTTTTTPHMISLDLELHLPCGSLPTKCTKNNTIFPSSSLNNFPENIQFLNRDEKKKVNSEELALFPSRSELFGGEQEEEEGGDDDDDKREMITAVCKKCHMLVMMWKSSPSCPNCKFMHPLDQIPPALFNQNLSLLC